MVDFPAGLLDFYLIDIGEPRDNSLRLVVVQTKLQDSQSPIPGVSGILARAILPTKKQRPLELLWRSYGAYSVRNESFADWDQYEQARSGRLSIREKSAYLDFVAASTMASDFHPGPFRHWELVCLNHVVDVVSCVEPEIKLG